MRLLENWIKKKSFKIRFFNYENKKQLIDAHATNDIEHIYVMMQEAMKEYKKFGEYLIDERNKCFIRTTTSKIIIG